jgi:hypothetical protein
MLDLSSDREWDFKLKTRDTSLVSLMIAQVISLRLMPNLQFGVNTERWEPIPAKKWRCEVSVKMKDGGGDIEAEVVHSL